MNKHQGRPSTSKTQATPSTPHINRARPDTASASSTFFHGLPDNRANLGTPSPPPPPQDPRFGTATGLSVEQQTASSRQRQRQWEEHAMFIPYSSQNTSTESQLPLWEDTTPRKRHTVDSPDQCETPAWFPSLRLPGLQTERQQEAAGGGLYRSDACSYPAYRYPAFGSSGKRPVPD